MTVRRIEVRERVIARNDELAAQVRARLARHGVTAINLMSSPGAGKTTLLERTLAVIDYARNETASKAAIERCPTGAIVWLEGDRIAKGKHAKKIIRIEPLPVTAEA